MSDAVPAAFSVTGYTLAQIAQEFGLHLRPAATQSEHEFTQQKIHAVAPLNRAQSGEISFLAQARYRSSLAQCQASAVILTAEAAQDWSGPALISTSPLVDFAHVASLFELRPNYSLGVHPHASIDPSARLSPGCRVAAGAVVGAHVVVGENCLIGPACVIEDYAAIGANSQLLARVNIGHHAQLGARCLIHPGVVIGADGFGQAWAQDHWEKIPQLGRVIIGNDVEIGANTTIDRGALDDTIIEDGVRIDNLVQIAHNVRIGAHTAIAACVGIAGSAVIGRYCLIGGAAAILGHIQICDRVIVQGMSSITHSIEEPGEYGSAVAAQEAKLWRRNLARLRNLDKILRDLMRNHRQ